MLLRHISYVFVVQLCVVCSAPAAEVLPLAPATQPLAAPDADGFIQLFNGRDLTGWMGLPGYWSVTDGTIRGHQTKETSRQTFLILSSLTIRDFELRFSYRFASAEGNSGLQFRSKLLDLQTYRVGGYQADFDAEGKFDGSIYDEAGIAGKRDMLSNRGQATYWDSENRRHVETLSQNSSDLGSLTRRGGWNDAVLLARGNRILYSVNGHLMTDLRDESSTALREGLLALQLHEGFTMDVRFKDLRIKLLQQ
jgi:hypothetical protein